jgi:hypothetical protein
MGEGGDPIDDFKFNSGEEDFADDYENIKQELFDAVLSKYPEETMQFLNGIAERGDEEIASLLSKLQQEEPNELKEPKHPTDVDEIVPSGADTGYNAEFGGGEG